MNKILLSGIAIFALGSVAFAADYSSYSEAAEAGAAAYKAKKFEDMRSAYAQAKKFATSDHQKWHSATFEIRACREMKKWDDALKLADEYLAGNPPENLKAATIFVKGLIFNSKGDHDKGTLLLEEALACSDLFGYIKEQAMFIVMQHYYTKQEFDKCIDRATKIIADKASPKSSVEYARFYIAQCKLDQKKYEECEKVVKEYAPLVEMPSIKARMTYIQAFLHLQKGENEEAVKCFEECIKNEPNGWRATNAKKQITRIKSL